MFPKPRRVQSESAKARIRKLSCIVCGKNPPSDCCHIKTKGSGGPDSEWNLIPQCRKHHLEQGSKGWAWMIEHYEPLRKHLDELGWNLEDNKLKHWGDV